MLARRTKQAFSLLFAITRQQFEKKYKNVVKKEYLYMRNLAINLRWI